MFCIIMIRHPSFLYVGKLVESTTGRERQRDRKRKREKERERENKEAVKGNNGNWGIISSFRICTCAAMTLCNRNKEAVKTMILGV
jgi:hypothetical protein